MCDDLCAFPSLLKACISTFTVKEEKENVYNEIFYDATWKLMILYILAVSNNHVNAFSKLSLFSFFFLKLGFIPYSLNHEIP